MHAYLLAWWFGFGAVCACVLFGACYVVFVIWRKLRWPSGRHTFRLAYDFFRRQPGRTSRIRAAWIGLYEVWVNRGII